MARVRPTAAFFDTSVLIAGLIELGSAAEAAAQHIFDAVAEGRIRRPLTAWHCCLELYSVSTRLPQEYRISAGDARRLLEEEILARFRVADLPPAVRSSFLAGVAREGIAGGRVYDAHIAEVARRAGATVVVTENARHFSALPPLGIRVLDATAFAATMPAGS